jgi:Domain of unknown function (DUF4157)
MSRVSRASKSTDVPASLAPLGTGSPASAAMTVSAAGRDAILQAKMVVGAANDPLEREADAIADKFVSGGGEAASASADTAVGSADVGAVQRSAAEDAAVVSPARAGMVQRSADPEAGSFGAPEMAEQHINATRGSGTPLPEIFRTKMETMTGSDLSAVRMHTDSGSAEAAESVNAKAFTVGSDIYFGAGASPSDSHLLAHETAHVVQQG